MLEAGAASRASERIAKSATALLDRCDTFPSPPGIGRRARCEPLTPEIRQYTGRSRMVNRTPHPRQFSFTRFVAVALVTSFVAFAPVPGSGAAGAGPAAGSQTAATPSSDENPLLAKQRDALSELERLGERRQELLTQLRQAQGDQREAVRLQVRDVDKDIRRILAALPDLVDQMRKENLDPAVVAKRASELSVAEARLIRADIDALQAEVAKLQKSDEKLDPSELGARKDRIAKQFATLDALLDDLFDNAQRAQRLGAQSTEDLAYLDKLIEARATAAAGEIKLAVEQLGSLNDQLGKAAASDKEKLQAQIGALQTAKDGAVASLTKLVALMKKRELDATAYSELLIRTTGQISTETLSADVARSFLEHQLADFQNWLRESGPSIGFRILVVLGILLAFVLLARLVRVIVRKAVGRSSLGASKLMQRFAVRMSGGFVMLVGLFVVLSQFNIDVGHMLAGLGIAGFIVGFALQDVLANFASGIMILAYRPYDVGDWIEVPDAFGQVKHMNMASTTILTGDNQKLLVPNKKIWGSTIRNITSETTRRVDLTFGIGYSDDMALAERILHEVVEADERVLKTPAEPLIRMTELGESSVNFILRAWCRIEDYWELRWHITRRVKERFDEEGVTIPFPQRDVHLYQATAPVREPAS